MKGLIAGIDGSRLRSGGGRNHLIEFLRHSRPEQWGFERVHLWASRSLMDEIDNRPWLVRHSPAELERSILSEMWWQWHSLSKELLQQECHCLFSPSAVTMCKYGPTVVMCQNLLPFEPAASALYVSPLGKLDFWLKGMLQLHSMKRAAGVIFLTPYAERVVQKGTKRLSNVACIPHGVSDRFREVYKFRAGRQFSTPIQCIYVSQVDPYKHVDSVIAAVALLRAKGLNVKVNLIGGPGQAFDSVNRVVAKLDPAYTFVHFLGKIPSRDIPRQLAKSDIFVFASSCENMPITLLEGMAAGLPIACSNVGPMPEIVEDAAIYFEPSSVDSIAKAIETIIADKFLRLRIGARACELSARYTWSNCADQTWRFLAATAARKCQRI